MFARTNLVAEDLDLTVATVEGRLRVDHIVECVHLHMQWKTTHALLIGEVR